jgi:hypothetical protein
MVLSVPFIYGVILFESALQGLGFSVPATPRTSFLAAKSRSEILRALVLVVVLAVTEGTISPGYLILRFRAATASSAAAVLLSAAVFSLGHGYESSAG